MTRYWQDLRLGERFTTDSLTLAREDILAFAAEFDPQPYHLDSAAAEDSIFGGLCASGWQVAALMMRLLTDTLHQQRIPVLGVASVPAMRWKAPVFAGDVLSAEFSIVGQERESRQAGCGSIDLDVTVQNQDARPVVVLGTRLLVPHAEVTHAG